MKTVKLEAMKVVELYYGTVSVTITIWELSQ